MMENSKNILGLEDAYEIAQSIVGNVRLSASLFVEVADALRAAEQERDQYKAELVECSRLIEQMQASEHQKHLELESLRAKIKEAQDGTRQVGWYNQFYRTFFRLEDLAATERNNELLESGELIRVYSEPVTPD